MTANRDETRGAVKMLLQQSLAPRSISQIRKELAGSIRVPSKDLGALLDEMTTAGDIFSWPKASFWNRDPRRVLPELILAFMAKSMVANASKIKTNLKLPLELIQPALKELVDAGRTHIWQPGKTAFFCLSDPRKTAQENILNALANGPLNEKELVGWVRKRLPGYQVKHLKEHVPYSKQIYEYPKYGKVKAKYGLEPPDPGPYLGKTMQHITAVYKLLAPFHISLEAIHEALGRELCLEQEEKPPSREQAQSERASLDAEPIILQGITRLQPPGQRRALVSIRELRRSVNLTKSIFDKAVLSLAFQGKVALHHHDFPASLAPDERDEMVRDEQGTFYVGIVPKEMS